MKNQRTHKPAEFAAYDSHFQVAMLIACHQPQREPEILSPLSDGVPVTTPGLGLLVYKLPVISYYMEGQQTIYSPGLVGFRLFWEQLARTYPGVNLVSKAKELALAYATTVRGPQARMLERMSDASPFFPGGCTFYRLDENKAGFGIRESDVVEIPWTGEQIFRTGMSLPYRDYTSVAWVPELVSPDGEQIDNKFFNPFFLPTQMGLQEEVLPDLPEDCILRYQESAVLRDSDVGSGDEKAGFIPASKFFREYSLDPVSFPLTIDMTRDNGFGGRRFTYLGGHANSDRIKAYYLRSLRKLLESVGVSKPTDFALPVSKEQLQEAVEAAEDVDMG